MDEACSRRLIACAGRRVRPECAKAIEDFLSDQLSDKYQFLMSEWLSPDQFRRATILWVVDDSEPWNDVHFALRNRIPLVIPHDNLLMKELCITASCGMSYGDANEARYCLTVLLHDDFVRQHLGANGHAYVTRTSVKPYGQ
jgi:hypothetical protein